MIGPLNKEQLEKLRYYCPKCDTEHITKLCPRCDVNMSKQDKITYKNVEGFPIPTFHCSKCGQSTEGFSLCLKCNLQSYTINQPRQDNVYAKQIWNGAIEAAAKHLEADHWRTVPSVIRGLKK